MKRVLLFLIVCSIVLLQACKKDAQSSSSTLTVSGFGAVAFASGDAISIYGTGFDPNPANDKVVFNGVPGEVATATANRLQVIAPILTSDGKITVTVNGKSVTSQQTYKIVNVLQGTYTNSFILTPDKQYLLRGAVSFTKKLIIEAGTVIYGEKLTHGSLTANDIDFEGTQQQPIVFTSDQAPGSRYPGDWTGVTITCSASTSGFNIPAPNGIMKYVRIEYAGYSAPGTQTLQQVQTNINPPAALYLAATPSSTYEYIQTSYSANAGIIISGLVTNAGGFTSGGAYVQHIVAFGCMGDDFRFITSGINAQYGLGLKDPYFAAITYGNGIAAGGAGSALLSNFTIIGYSPDARNLPGNTITNSAGSGVQVGELAVSSGAPTSSSDNIVIYNSVIAGGWRAGVSIGGLYGSDWNYYENGTYIRNCYVASSGPQLLPQRAGAFGQLYGPSNTSSELYYVDISNDPKRALFAQYNDTTKALSFSANKDDLGIKNLADYNNLNNPGVLPAAGSILLTGAIFPSGSPIDNPFINKDVTYVGAFSTDDWTAMWCNFKPQTTQY